jgi:hypothetical protein
MSFKTIDMQIAVQKSNEIGYKQNQLMQKTVIDQSLIASNTEKSTEAARHKSSKVDETTNHRIREEQQKEKNKGLKSTKKQQDKTVIGAHRQEEVSLEHPFKGRHIDLSL